jgi:hypothetical protein
MGVWEKAAFWKGGSRGGGINFATNHVNIAVVFGLVSGRDASVGGEGDHDVRTMRSMPPDDSGGCISTKLVPNRTSDGGSATSPAGDDYYPVGVLGRSGRGVGRSVDLDVVIIFKTS